jgi:hypothetical protein
VPIRGAEGRVMKINGEGMEDKGAALPSTDVALLFNFFAELFLSRKFNAISPAPVIVIVVNPSLRSDFSFFLYTTRLYINVGRFFNSYC